MSRKLTEGTILFHPDGDVVLRISYESVVVLCGVDDRARLMGAISIGDAGYVVRVVHDFRRWKTLEELDEEEECRRS